MTKADFVDGVDNNPNLGGSKNTDTLGGKSMKITDVQLVNGGVLKTDHAMSLPKSAPVCVIDLPTRVIKQDVSKNITYRLDSVLEKELPKLSFPKVIVIKPKDKVLKYGIKRVPGLGKRRHVIRIIKSKLTAVHGNHRGIVSK